MAGAVDELKELLFDDESKALTDLSRRVDTLARTEAERRAEIGRRLDEVFERAGTSERFQSSVADVLDGALKKAEVDRHQPLADAMAPLVVKTVKLEIRNSRDELVEALYPMTGRMVKAYIASAMKDLADQINRRLETNPLMLGLRSLATGKSAAELAIAGAEVPHVDELYLIRRGSGELLGRWPAAASGEGRDQVMSGILTAINEFASEAFKSEGSALRQIDLGQSQVYLRASPSYLLAAKCSGTAPAAVEQVLDEAFLTTIERLHEDLDAHPSGAVPTSVQAERLGRLSGELDSKFAETQAEISGARLGASPLKILAWVIAVPAAAWLAWTLYGNYRTEQARAIAADVIAATERIKGYPVTLTVDRWGRTITLSGLAPAAAVKEELAGRLRGALAGSEIVDQLSVLPNELDAIEPEIARVRRELSGLDPEIARVRGEVAGLEPKIAEVHREVTGLEPRIAEVHREVTGLGPEISKVRKDMSGFAPEIAKVRSQVSALEPQLSEVRGDMAELAAEVRRQVVHRALERANRRLSDVAGDLPKLERSLDDAPSRSIVGRSVQSIRQTARELEPLRAQAVNTETDSRGMGELAAALDLLTLRVRQAGAELSGLISAEMARSYAPPTQRSGTADFARSAEELSAEAERLAILTVAVTQATALKKSLPPPPKPVIIENKPAEPTAREKLEAWTRANAVFFGNGVEYRNAERAERTLDALAALMRDADVLVRAVGYTDDQGGQSRNSSLSQERAQKVVAALLARSVPAGRLVAVGRLDSLDLSPTSGESSPNRRVEFEVGFEGEGAQ